MKSLQFSFHNTEVFGKFMQQKTQAMKLLKNLSSEIDELIKLYNNQLPKLFCTHLRNIAQNYQAHIEQLDNEYQEVKNENRKYQEIRQKLEDERNLLHSLFEAIPDPIYIKDRNSCFTFVNKAQAELLGTSQEKAIGTSDFNFFDHAEEAFHDEQQIIQTGKPIKNKLEYIHDANQDYIYVLATKVPLRDNTGKIIGTVGTSRDISNQVKIEQELKSRTLWLKKIINAVGDGITLSNNKGEFEIYSKEMKNITGYSPEEINCGKSFLDKLYPDPAKRNRVLFELALLRVNKQNKNIETKIVCKNGEEKTLLVSSVIIFQNNTEYYLSIYRDITDRIKAEEALRENEIKYRNFAENISEGIYSTNRNGIFTGVNQVLVKMFGFKNEEDLTGLPAWQLAKPGEREQTREKFIEKAMQGDTSPLEVECIKRDGTVFWAEIKLNTENNLQYSFGTVTDITEQKKAQEALRRSEKKYRTLFNQMINGYTIIEPIWDTENQMVDFKYIELNPAFERLTGLKQEQALNHTVKELLPGIEDTWFRHFSKLFKDKKNISFVNYLKPLDKYYAVDAFLYAENQIAVVFEDITKRKKTEQALQLNEERYALAQRAANIGSWDWNIKTNEVYWSEHIEPLFGFERGTFKGTYEAFLELVHPEDKKIITDAVYQSLNNKADYKVEHRIIAPDKTIRWMQGSADVLYDDNKKPKRLIGVVMDITEQKKAQEKIEEQYKHLQASEEELRQNTEELRTVNESLEKTRELLIALLKKEKAGRVELEKAKKAAEAANQAKSEFLDNMSHEIRTPMNSILGFTELLVKQINNQKYKNYLQSIKSSGNTLMNLINDILDLSKIEAGKMVIKLNPVNLRAIVDEIEHIFYLKIKQKKLQWIKQIDERIPGFVKTDELRIRQILLNLTGNAIKFTSKGSVKIKIDCLQISNNKLDIDISVEDTGIGIPKNELNHIFDAFKQHEQHDTKKFGGTGLGLAITKRLTNMLNGTIRVQSEPDKGSTFTVQLLNIEIVETGKIFENKKITENEDIIFEKATILIADDVKMNRDLLCSYFENTNISTLKAENGTQTLILAQQHQPDVILLDLRMPEMNGWEAIQTIRDSKNLKNTVVIAVSASGLGHIKNKASIKQFDGFLQKPINSRDLFHEIARFLPHKKQKPTIKKDRDTNIIPLKINEIPPTKLTDLIEYLDKQLYERWMLCSHTDDIAEIEKFGGELIKTGKKAGMKKLILLGEKIITYTENFDLENIEKALRYYPEIINQLKKHIKTNSL